MRIATLGQFREQFSHVVTSVEPRQVALCRPKAPLELGFGQQVEAVGRFAQEHYANERQKVKSALERPLGTAGTFGQSADFGEVFGKLADDAACLAELDDLQNDCLRL